ncbi:MAG: hypothetical protein ACFCUQ_20260 [Kiloniellales bacterium]
MPESVADGDAAKLEAKQGVTEVVGRFAERASFEDAVKALRAAGFEESDLSLLDTHESLSASESELEAWRQRLASLVGEVNYIGPITAAGLIMLASEPLGVAIAGLVGAGFAGAAVKELLDEMRATPHTEAFAKALELGAVLLWVRAQTPERQERAKAILLKHGAADVHTHTRPVAG